MFISKNKHVSDLCRTLYGVQSHPTLRHLVQATFVYLTKFLILKGNTGSFDVAGMHKLTINNTITIYKTHKKCRQFLTVHQLFPTQNEH